MGKVYAETLIRSNLRWRSQLVGVCDSNFPAAEELGLHTGARAFSNVAEMLRALEPDAAYIAVPDHLHSEPFLICIENGVPVLVEKPLATDPETARAMRRATLDADVYAECNFSNRSNPAFKTVKDTIERGEVGEVISVTAHLNNTIRHPTSLLRWAADSSPGWFLLSHVFDLSSWLTGARATEVTAQGVRRVLKSRGVDTYDLIHALVRYDRELSGVYESAWSLPDSLPSPVDFAFRVLGTEGAVYVDTSDQMVHVAGHSTYTHPSTNDWTEARLTEFLNRVEGDRPIDPLADALNNTLLLVALHDALESGRPVAVPAADEAAPKPETES